METTTNAGQAFVKNEEAREVTNAQVTIGSRTFTGRLALAICVSQDSESAGKSEIAIEGLKVEPHHITAAIEALDALRNELIEKLIETTISSVDANESDELEQEGEEPSSFNHLDVARDTNPSRGLNPTPHHNPSSTASASYFRD